MGVLNCFRIIMLCGETSIIYKLLTILAIGLAELAFLGYFLGWGQQFFPSKIISALSSQIPCHVFVS